VANPELAVISVGADNAYGHPNPEVLRRLEDRLGSENIYRTDEDGTIEFITDGERLWVRTER
jgi:competence protein ComEC